jgi:hypothetical protein
MLSATMAEHFQSASTRLFQDSAEELAARLERHGSEAAKAMACEARELAGLFASWATQRPTDELRFATVQRLFALNRRVSDYLPEAAEG